MISLQLVIAVIGVIVGVVMKLPMPDVFKTAIYVLAAIFIILLLMRAVGLVDPALPQL